MSARRVSPAEWRWVAVAALLLMFLTTVPYVVGMLNETPEMTFGGFLFGLDDMHSYLAKMRYGARDGWLFHLVYTHEPHRGGVVFVFHLALGKLAAWVTGEGALVSARALVFTYHAARVVFGLLLLAVLYRFVAEYLEKPSRRRLAWTVAALMGGLGWVLLLIASLTGLDLSAAFDLGANAFATTPLELYVPEAFTLLLLYGLPHLALARSLLLIGWLVFFRSLDADDWRRALLAGLAWLGMGVIVPFYAALLGVLIATWLAGLLVLRRRLPGAELRLAALAGAFPLAILLYNVWLFSGDPVFAAWSAQNQLASPPLLDYLLAYGLWIGLGGVGLAGLLRRGLTRRTVLLVSWPLAVALMVYLPVNVQRRLLEGVIVPLSVLATLGAWRLVGEKRPGFGWRLRWLALAGLIGLSLPSVVLLLGGGVLTASEPRWPVFHPADELAALDWLRGHAPPESVVLSTFESGNVIPAYAGVRVYVGHGPETVNSGQKRILAERFFQGEMSDSERRALLEEAGVAYVWVGPLERGEGCAGTGCFDPARLGLREVFSQGRYIIYEVPRP
ncbi:MAG TPA: hypothetical protein ENI95_05970 [Chloroflexi bacterium]|nr:hypothetical protein [Chloroflexota bacterium]